MGSALTSIPVWILIITAAAFFIVMGIHRRNPAERINKFIPSIVCFVFAVNMAYILLYGGDTILTNLFIILLVVFLQFVSVVGLFSTLLIAWAIDLRELRKHKKEGLNGNEEI